MKKRPKNLYCYKEDNIQKWVMSDNENDEEILLNILINKHVDKSSLFAIPIIGMLGIIWLSKKDHPNMRGDIWNFFEEYNTPQTGISKYEESKKIAESIKQEKESKRNSKFGFISPDGRYFHCDYQGHSSLAYDICFGQFETNNPEKYLEEHGWCKIYNPCNTKNHYAVYVGGNYALTDSQMKKLVELGLDNAKDVSKMLIKERIRNEQ